MIDLIVGRGSRLRLMWTLALVALFVAPGPIVHAQAIQLQGLTDPEFKALEWANQKSVTATISFLASDELEGRGTPSAGLTIASAYVASRFRGAGLEGLGRDGSFYLESTVDTVTSAGGATLRVEGSARRCSLLYGGEDEFSLSGTVPLVRDIGDVSDLPSAIAMRWSDLQEDTGSGSVTLRRTAQRCARMGARALLLAVGDDQAFWDWATRQQHEPRIVGRRSRFPLPVLFIESCDWDADATVEMHLPGDIKRSSAVRNTCGVLRGSDPMLRDQVIVFSAHLDHLGRYGVGEDTIFNGADDDASGVTGVLTLADVFAGLPERPARSLMFLTFWGEERGLLGSRQFTENAVWPLNQVVACVNIEMIGRPEQDARNKIWMTGWDKSDLGSLMNIGARRLGVEIFEHTQYSPRLYRASDNASFVRQGVIAHSFSAGSLHEDYHQRSDEWQKLDLPHMTQVIRGLFAGALPIAKGIVTPKVD